MSTHDEYKDRLEDNEFMLGKSRGRLAVTLDILTDALLVAGNHSIYCRTSDKDDKPSTDMQAINDRIELAKRMVQSVMQELEKE